MSRTPQLRTSFVAGDPSSGYYNDLTAAPLGYGADIEEVLAWFQLIVRTRERVNPVSAVQLGLGAWQLSQQDARWLAVVQEVCEWLTVDMDGHGRLAYCFDMAHTYELVGPWHSAMAQGQAASLLVRAAASLKQPELLDQALRAGKALVDPACGLIADTPEGPVLQEYPTNPPSHVLNGWIFALWGLHDLHVTTADTRCEQSWEQGIETLAARLHLYEVANGWTRYDLYPHPVVHVASPFYHRLHIEQLRALDQLAPNPVFAQTADRWSAVARRRLVVAQAVARKIGFRMLRPRKKVA